MGKGGRPGVVAGAASSVRPTEVWHYTRSRDALEISRACFFYKSAVGTDGPGVYFTDIRPSSDRKRISRALWDGWKPANMTAYLHVPFNAADMLESVVPNVWYVPDSDYSITGQDDLAMGFWEGADWTDPNDVGTWAERALVCP